VSAAREGLLVIRADAGVAVGIGHVMRCLALAQAWRDRGRDAAFVLADAPPELERELGRERFAIHCLDAPAGGEADARETAEFARRGRAWWILLDGYGFGDEYQRILKSAPFRLARIEDDTADPGFADLVVNQNAHAAERVDEPPSPRVLRGTRYALIRREFQRWLPFRHPIEPQARRILITMGGSDPDNAAETVLRSLRNVGGTDFRIRIVSGPANPHRDSLRRELVLHEGRAELIAGDADMPELMAWADLAVSAAGSTSWELAFMGVPMVAVILAENQRRIARSLEEAQVAVGLGWHATLREATVAAAVARLLPDALGRTAMSRRGRELVDGLGARRAAEALENAIVESRSA
jgi:UDP-2,4-diacetamido-2,4,6-trideoxy-beta-L-altropyranose hydrolase